MVQALDFAHHLIGLANKEDEPDCLTQLQIHKLLYYVQGWSLAVRSRPAFQETIEAWTNGPVVKAVRSHFAQFSSQAVANCCESMNDDLSDEDKFFVEVVWNSYKQFSPIGLRDKTHLESPWKDARGNLPLTAKSTAPISLDSMRTFFEQQKALDVDCHFVGIPNWNESDDEDFVKLAKASFIRNSALLRRLAQ